MTRLVASLAAAAVVLTGCSGSGAKSVLDPFSRTTVEPPRTGCIMGQPADPYYSGTRQAALPGGPATTSDTWKSRGAAADTSDSTTVPIAARPRTSSRIEASQRDYDDRGAVAENRVSRPATGPGDRLIIPLAARAPVDTPIRRQGPNESLVAAARTKAPDRSAAAASSAAATTEASGARPGEPSRQGATSAAGAMLASREPIVRTIQPGPRAPAGPAAAGLATQRPGSAGNEPRRFAPSGQTINIMDLPEPGSSRGVRSASNGAQGAIRLVSATEEIRSTPGDSFAPRAQFSHDPDYRRLRGRLEYSDIDRKWKLRYIPIDGTTDEFGGSVVLPDASLLSGYERGQFVEVRGTLGAAPEDEDRGYAPEYQVRELKLLGP